MKIFILVVLYFVIGIVSSSIVYQILIINEHEASINKFNDLDLDDKILMVLALLLWPFLVILFIFYLIFKVLMKFILSFVFDAVIRQTNRRNSSE